MRLESQKAIVEYFAKTDKADVVKEYIDYSNGNNNELHNAIGFCLKHKCTLIVASVDRLSDNIDHVFAIKKKLGNLFKCCDVPSSDSLSLSIYMGILQRKKLLISIRTKAAFKAKKSQ